MHSIYHQFQMIFQSPSQKMILSSATSVIYRECCTNQTNFFFPHSKNFFQKKAFCIECQAEPFSPSTTFFLFFQRKTPPSNLLLRQRQQSGGFSLSTHAFFPKTTKEPSGSIKKIKNSNTFRGLIQSQGTKQSRSPIQNRLVLVTVCCFRSNEESCCK